MIPTEHKITVTEGELFTLRDFNYAGEGIDVRLGEIQATLNDCVSVVDDTMNYPFENEYYAQITLRIEKDDCRWIYNATDAPLRSYVFNSWSMENPDDYLMGDLYEIG
jgi:hypothetical protein